LRQEKEKENESREVHIADIPVEEMVPSVSENKIFIPNKKEDHQDCRKKKERKFRKPFLDVLPTILGVVIFEVGDPSNKHEPQDIVLTHDDAQDAENAGKPKPLVERGP